LYSYNTYDDKFKNPLILFSHSSSPKRHHFLLSICVRVFLYISTNKYQSQKEKKNSHFTRFFISSRYFLGFPHSSSSLTHSIHFLHQILAVKHILLAQGNSIISHVSFFILLGNSFFSST
jgi:hypothetical protein